MAICKVCVMGSSKAARRLTKWEKKIKKPLCSIDKEPEARDFRTWTYNNDHSWEWEKFWVDRWLRLDVVVPEAARGFVEMGRRVVGDLWSNLWNGHVRGWPKCHPPTQPDHASESRNKQQNILETWFESSFLAVDFIFSFRFLVIVQRAFRCFCYTRRERK